MDPAKLIEMGPVVWGLAGLSAFGLGLVLERGAFWVAEGRRARAFDPPAELRRLRDDRPADPGAPPPALGRVLREAFRGGPPGPDALDAALGLEDLRARRGLGALEAIVAAAPMLGILGTVLGLMDAFETLGVDGGDPRGVIRGLSSALSTTAVGLTVSLGGLLPLRLLEARAEVATRGLEADLAALGLDATEGLDG